MIDATTLESLSLTDMTRQLYNAVKAGRTLSGEAAAILARRLVAQEAAVGGPYWNEKGTVDRELNQSVARLMRALGSPLPNVEAYLNFAEPVTRHAASISVRKVVTPVYQDTEAIIKQTALPLWTTLQDALAAIARVDESGEISRLSELFERSLASTPRESSAHTFGVANLLTWIAYSIYDDFIDDEGEPKRLPAANVAHREALALYQTALPPDATVRPNVVFRSMDEANAWEVVNCRFAVNGNTITIGTLPRYGRLMMLAARARAHVLGPLMIVERTASSEQLGRAAWALDRYLIARQLNDDLHDWVKDVRRGHISPVVAGLLKDARIEPGDYDMTTLIDTLQKTFWRSSLASWSHRGLRAIKDSERGLVESGVLRPDSPFVNDILRPIGDVLRRGLARHTEDERFLEAYSRSLPRANRPK